MMVRRRRFHSQKVQMPKLRGLAGDTKLLSRRRYQHRRLKRPARHPPKTRNLFLCGEMERCFLRWPTPGIEGRCGTLRPKVCDTRSRRMRWIWTQRGNSTNNVDFLHAFDSQYSPGDVFNAQIKRAAFQ